MVSNGKSPTIQGPLFSGRVDDLYVAEARADLLQRRPGWWSVVGGLLRPMCRATNPVDGWRVGDFFMFEVGEFYSLLPQLPPMEVVSWIKYEHGALEDQFRFQQEQGQFLKSFP